MKRKQCLELYSLYATAVRCRRDIKSKHIKENTLYDKVRVPDTKKYFQKQYNCVNVGSFDCNMPRSHPDDVALQCTALIDSISFCGLHNEKNINKTSKNSSLNIKSCSAEMVNSNCSVAKKKIKKPTLVSKNSLITDYFPVRRSNRKTTVSKLTEKNKIIEDAILSGKEDGFEIKEFPDKGRGIITTKAIKRGEFVLEYYGELIDYKEARRREGFYSGKENVGCYMYFFEFKNKQYCVDATKETDRLGRLVNHSKKGNLKTRTFLIKDSPHLILCAGRDIQPGEELSYDYGDRRRAALESHPWLKF